MFKRNKNDHAGDFYRLDGWTSVFLVVKDFRANVSSRLNGPLE